MVLGALGIVDRAPLEISEALRRLNLSHTLTWRDGVRNSVLRIDGLCKEQPLWPVVVDSVRHLNRIGASGRIVYLVADSRAALSNTNIRTTMWPENRSHESFTESLASALVSLHSEYPEKNTWMLKTVEPSLMDYVNTAVKPSHLSEYQKLVYKINPYALRKEVQDMCIAYMVGAVKPKVLKAKLDTSFKLQPLQDLMFSPEANKIKTSVLIAKEDLKCVDSICKANGLSSFDVLYWVKAWATRSAMKTPKKKA